MAFAKLGGWAGGRDEMKGWGPSKARRQKPLAFAIYVPDGGHTMQPPRFPPSLCSPSALLPFTPSLCSFFFLSWPTPTHLQIPFFDFLTQLGGRASRTQRQDPSGTAEVDSGRLKDRGAEEITLFVHWMGTTEGTIAAFKQVAAAESISLA